LVQLYEALEIVRRGNHLPCVAKITFSGYLLHCPIQNDVLVGSDR